MAGLGKLVALALLPLAAYGATPYPPASTNCTEASSKAVNWVIRNLTVNTETRFDFGPGTAGKVSFSVKNTANGYTFDCSQGERVAGQSPNHYLVDGKVWYGCSTFCKGARGEPDRDDPPLDTSFHIDVKDKALSISQTWGCGGSKP